MNGEVILSDKDLGKIGNFFLENRRLTLGTKSGYVLPNIPGVRFVKENSILKTIQNRDAVIHLATGSKTVAEEFPRHFREECDDFGESIVTAKDETIGSPPLRGTGISPRNTLNTVRIAEKKKNRAASVFRGKRMKRESCPPSFFSSFFTLQRETAVTAK